MERPADTAYPVLDVIRRRWSPRLFDSRPVEKQKLLSVLEAARWSASSFNEQPWRFILATRDDQASFAKALGCLAEKNQAWAKHVPVLILTCARTHFTHGDKPNRVHLHDIGLAAAHLTLQATSLGLFVHQMAGIDPQAVRETYGVPDRFEPATAIALGYASEDEPAGMEDWIVAGDRAPRVRKPLSEIVFDGAWGEPSGWVVDS